MFSDVKTGWLRQGGGKRETRQGVVHTSFSGVLKTSLGLASTASVAATRKTVEQQSLQSLLLVQASYAPVSITIRQKDRSQDGLRIEQENAHSILRQPRALPPERRLSF
jgi:hypothetical protein